MKEQIESALLDGEVQEEEIAHEWDLNVVSRANELEYESDLTYYEILVPEMYKLATQYAKGSKALDVGCGLGYLTNKFHKERYFEVEGIDISTGSIRYATSRFPNIRFYSHSINTHSQDNPYIYDVCIANMVFHNIYDVKSNLLSINSMLKDTGCLVASIPHPCFWFQRYSKINYLDNNKAYKVHFKIRNHKEHPSPITYIHRSISWYLKILILSGFNLVDFFEPETFNPGGSDLLLLVLEKNSNFC